MDQEKSDEFDYILIPVEVSPETAAEINEKFAGSDKKNRQNILLHTWSGAELFGKER